MLTIDELWGIGSDEAVRKVLIYAHNYCNVTSRKLAEWLCLGERINEVDVLLNSDGDFCQAVDLKIDEPEWRLLVDMAYEVGGYGRSGIGHDPLKTANAFIGKPEGFGGYIQETGEIRTDKGVIPLVKNGPGGDYTHDYHGDEVDSGVGGVEVLKVPCAAERSAAVLEHMPRTPRWLEWVIAVAFILYAFWAVLSWFKLF